MLEINRESAVHAAKVSSTEWELALDFHESRVIEKLTKISGLIDPYSMEFVRTPSVSFEDVFCLVDILYSISEELKDYQVYKSKLLGSEDHYELKLDVRYLTQELGIEVYGRLFKFLEKMTVKFIDHPQLMVIDKLKYNSFNGSDYLEQVAHSKRNEENKAQLLEFVDDGFITMDDVLEKLS